MGQAQCPICYSPLEVRDVTPCFICGGWPEAVERFTTATEFTESRLPGGQSLVLCRGCRLEDFMVADGWGYRLVPGETLPANGLRWVRQAEEPRLGRDKFCPTCNVRLAFAEVIASAHEAAEPGAAADPARLSAPETTAVTGGPGS
ncbi:hypothetical protein J0H58_38710 [bacterium]|nr:hypothetical protein [bacterium]